jgi:hypothetical protein
MRIGKVLKDARTRADLDIRTVEERTKIRVKYLRALEGEDWEALPNPAYAKGFLRTYAQLLGLDAEALVDEFRRQAEPDPGATGYPLGDQVLESRRRPNGGRRGVPPLALAGVAAVAAIATALGIGLLSDDDEGGARPLGEPAKKQGDQREPAAARAEGKVTLALAVREPVEVCLLGGGGEALIDGQVLAAGAQESYRRHRFELRFPKGFDKDQFRLELDGKRRVLPQADGPAAYEIVAPRRVDRAPAPSEECG